MIPRIEDFKNDASIPNLRQVANVSEPLIDSVYKSLVDFINYLNFQISHLKFFD